MGLPSPIRSSSSNMIMEKEGTKDRQDMKKILDSFEVIRKR